MVLFSPPAALGCDGACRGGWWVAVVPGCITARPLVSKAASGATAIATRGLTAPARSHPTGCGWALIIPGTELTRMSATFGECNLPEFASTQESLLLLYPSCIKRITTPPQSRPNTSAA